MKSTYAGLFMVTLATLMYEILLTRIFSVTTWYHFAFFAVSVAMFGMTVGALIVYLSPNRFTQDRAIYHLSLDSLLFAIATPLSFLAHMSLPFITDGSLIGFGSMGLTYIVISIPFIFSGITVCIALTKFPSAVSKLYAADLAGAALGCILLVYVLNLTDAPTAILLVSFCASAASVLFISYLKPTNLRRMAVVTSLLFASLTFAQGLFAFKDFPLLRIVWFKGEREERRPLYEKWNSFSYVRVFGDPNELDFPAGPGFSPNYPRDQKVQQLYLDIDARALTVLTKFHGDPAELKFLKYDIANLAHYLRPNASVLVIGTGGGRDILSALAFDQKSVVGVEINNNIVEAVTKRFSDFTGHLERNPKVTFVNDEARSYVARQNNRFDIIQVSLIDTWAATAAGAFVLTENPLYTVEGWKTFLEHLSPRGILTFSRWHFRNRPGEVYRVTALARASLAAIGIENPRNHIMIVTKTWKPEKPGEPDGIGTILVSTEPFSQTDISVSEKVLSQLGFTMILGPKMSSDPTLATIASDKDVKTLYAHFPLNITPPTDDSPFFFHMLRLKDAFKPELWEQGETSFNMKAVSILGVLLIVVLFLTSLCILVPLAWTADKSTLSGACPLLVFFGCIGLGYMLVEISQMQRLIIFLGHPTYGLSVVLFALLLSSGLGSYSTQSKGSGISWLLILLCVLLVFGTLTPYVIRTFDGSTTPIRILLATAILFPIGFFMGMPFPIGMRIGAAKSPALTPWLWGINGAASVCASVLAVAIALSSSISASFWTGFVCYSVAVIAYVWTTRKSSLRRFKFPYFRGHKAVSLIHNRSNPSSSRSSS